MLQDEANITNTAIMSNKSKLSSTEKFWLKKKC